MLKKYFLLKKSAYAKIWGQKTCDVIDNNGKFAKKNFESANNFCP